MNAYKGKISLPKCDRLLRGRRGKRNQTWPNGWNPLALATIPESDAGKSPEKHFSRALRAEAVADLRDVHLQDEHFRGIIRDVLKSYLSQFSEYNHSLFGRLGPLLSELIKVRVEEESRESRTRYKIVSQVYIGAVVDDGIDVATQCLWTPCCDKFATASYGTKTLFAIGTVFAVQI